MPRRSSLLPLQAGCDAGGPHAYPCALVLDIVRVVGNNAVHPEAGLTVEAVMTGGALPASPPLMLGPQAEQSFDLDRPLREARDAFEKSYFEFHLAQEHGSMTRVAEKTGLERTHLYRKLKQLGVDLSRNKRGGM